MTIQSAKWTESGSIEVTYEGGIVKYIPDNTGNRDRRELNEWEQEGNTIAAYIAPPIYTTADEAKAAIVVWVDEFTAGVTGHIPKDEKLSWGAKEAAGEAHLAGTADAKQTALLQGEADLTGETLDELSTAIISRAAVFHIVISKVAGLRRAMGVAIDAESDPYNYETILTNGKTQAIAMATALGL